MKNHFYTINFCIAKFHVVIPGLLLCLITSTGFSQTGPIGTSLSGPSSAKIGFDPELMFSNPASLSAQKDVYLGTMATFGHSSRLELTRNIALKNSYTVYVVDRGSDLLFPLSVFYIRNYLSTQSPTTTSHMNSIYVATVFDISPTLSIGGGYYRTKVEQSSSNHLKLGAVYTLSETVSLGASYHQDLSSRDNSDDAINIGAKMLVLNRTAIYLDFTRRSWAYTIRGNDDIANRNSMLSLGIENKISDFMIRLGANTPFSKNVKDVHFSCGIGYDGPKIGVNYGFGYHKPVTNNPDESINNYTHGLNLNIYF